MAHTVQLTNDINIPGLDYINQLAKEKNVNFDSSFGVAPDILKDLFYLFTKEREDPVGFDKMQHMLSRSTIATHKLMRPLNSSEEAYYLYTLDFLLKTDIVGITGFSPMDKALNVLMYMVKIAPEEGEDEKYGATTVTIEDEETKVTPKSLDTAIKHFSGQKVTTTSDKTDIPVEAHLSQDLTSCVRDYLYDLSPEIVSIYGKSSKLQVPINKQILKDIKIKAYLEDKLGMQEAKDLKKKEDNSSRRRQSMQMTQTSDLARINKAKMLMPDFDDKVAKKEIHVNKKVSPVKAKQMFTMLVDDSGSMGCVSKQAHVRAVLLNRLEPVVKGHAELIFYHYESQRYGKKVVKDLKGAREIFAEMCQRIPRGGGTNIGACIQETIDEIWNMPGYHDPELMIVCDGDDHVDPTIIDFKGVKVNVIILGRKNKGLKEIAKNSKGFYTEECMY